MNSALIRFGIPALLFGAIAYVVYAADWGSSTPEQAEDADSSASGREVMPMDGARLDQFARDALKKLSVTKEERYFPDVELEGPTGAPIRLTDLDADILVVNFWEVYCPPCVHEMPTLADLQDRYPQDEVKVVALNFNTPKDLQLGRDKLDELTDGRLEFYRAPDLNLLFDVKARGFPTTLIYNRDGRELARLEGDADWASGESFALFDYLLAARPRPKTQNP